MKVGAAIKRRWQTWGIGAMLFLQCSHVAADGGLSLDRTRVIFQQANMAQSVTLRNRGEALYLIKSMITRDIAGKVAAPFWVTPPLFRLEPRSQNTLRILRQGESLPQDRESLFYFSALAIPATAKPSGASENQPKVAGALSLGVRSVIKMFYRPTGLVMKPTQAHEQLTFSYKNGNVTANNDSPYYLSLASLTLGTHSVNLNQVPSMVPPYSSVAFTTPPVTQVSWQLITDYGSVTERKTISISSTKNAKNVS
ncbi:fimbrial biogenesis chaperone [Serratia liquefaciens]|uniref:fimbrial biogenesis chaperone n=1 Tax=Serratia liquefaciens TaxID=614 RepID=UPI002157B422|nr:molecular chaperone [Serratia liquefaciens]